MEKKISRRAAVGTGSKVAAGLFTSGLTSQVHGAQAQSRRIRIGQIGTRHPHAAGKLATIRALDDTFELVGVVEPDEKRRKLLAENDTYRGIRWMSQKDLLTAT